MDTTDLNHGQKANPKIGVLKADSLLPQALIFLGFVSLIFAAVPELDLSISRVFWDPAAAGFEYRKNPAMVAFRDTNRYLPWIVVGLATVLLIAHPVLRTLKYAPAPHKLLFVLTFFAAGPGLGVELIKMVVGRARPRALAEFGGNAVFTPPWEITDQCVRNCSFISGEAASAFALLSLVVFVAPRYQTLYLGAVGIVAAAFSFNRVIFGGHFLSDVVIAWNVMLILALLLWQFFSRNAPQIDALFTRVPRQP